MIVYPCTNFFDCKFSQLEDQEEEIIFTHPFLPGIQCNQVGTLYFDEDMYTIYYNFGICTLRRANNEFRRSKIKIVWECYHGRETKDLIHFMDLNIYNFTRENLKPVKDMSEWEYDKRLSKRKKFIQKSAERLDRIQRRHPDFSPEEIFDRLELPVWIYNGWQKK
jgi:hypothetical protein